MGIIKAFIEATREKTAIRKQITAQVLESYQKTRQYRALVGSELNYAIIQDFVNAAARGVEVAVTLRDGSSFKMTRQAGPTDEELMRRYKDLF